MTLRPRDSSVATAAAVVAATGHDMPTWLFAIALACGIWYLFIVLVQAIGFTQLYARNQHDKGVMLILIQVPQLLHQTETRHISNFEA